MKRQKIRMLFIIMGILVGLLVIIVLGSMKLHRVEDAKEEETAKATDKEIVEETAKESGILLAFDDYSPDNWRQYFDLFEEYGVHVTFFIAWEEPTDFCFEALEKGHDIGFHSIGHTDVTAMSEEELQRCVIDPIEVFRKKGIELTSFAYPYGYRTDELDEKLLQYYKVVRGAYNTDRHSIEDLKSGHIYIDSGSIDNYHMRDEQDFQETVKDILDELNANKGSVISVYSHAIDAGDWCVTKEHLEYLFQQAEEQGIKFYTFSELTN